MAKRIGKWTKKLEDEHKQFAMVEMGCGTPSTQVAKMIEEKFGISISDVRLRVIRDSKTWFPVYDAARQKFLKEKVSVETIPMAAKAARMSEAESIAKKLIKLINKIDTKIDSLTEDGINEGSVKYVLALAKTLRETAKIYKDFLNYAKDETKESGNKSSSGSFLTQINVHTDGKSKMLPKEIIDVKPLDPNS